MFIIFGKLFIQKVIFQKVFKISRFITRCNRCAYLLTAKKDILQTLNVDRHGNK